MTEKYIKILFVYTLNTLFFLNKTTFQIFTIIESNQNCIVLRTVKN